MSTQPTSVAALHEATATGAATSTRTDVLQAFRMHGPGTSAEVLRAAGLDQNLNLMRARVTELADVGDIVEAGTAACNVSGRRAIVWRAIRDDEFRQPRVKAIRVDYTLAEAEIVRTALLRLPDHISTRASAYRKTSNAIDNAKGD